MADNKTMPAMNLDLERLAYDMAHAETDEDREGIRKEVLSLLDAMDNKAEGYLCVIDRITVEVEAAKRFAEQSLSVLVFTLTLFDLNHNRFNFNFIRPNNRYNRR